MIYIWLIGFALNLLNSLLLLQLEELEYYKTQYGKLINRWVSIKMSRGLLLSCIVVTLIPILNMFYGLLFCVVIADKINHGELRVKASSSLFKLFKWFNREICI